MTNQPPTYGFPPDSGDPETIDDEYSTVEVLWVSEPNGTVMLGSGVDINTGDTVEWAGDTRAMIILAQALEDEDTVYAQVPYWAERYRRQHETA